MLKLLLTMAMKGLNVQVQGFLQTQLLQVWVSEEAKHPPHAALCSKKYSAIELGPLMTPEKMCIGCD